MFDGGIFYMKIKEPAQTFLTHYGEQLDDLQSSPDEIGELPSCALSVTLLMDLSTYQLSLNSIHRPFLVRVLGSVGALLLNICIRQAHLYLQH